MVELLRATCALGASGAAYSSRTDTGRQEAVAVAAWRRCVVARASEFDAAAINLVADVAGLRVLVNLHRLLVFRSVRDNMIAVPCRSKTGGRRSEPAVGEDGKLWG